MSKDTGPREKALRAMREAKFADNSRIAGGIRRAAVAGKIVLEQRVEAAKKRGRPRKKK